jgi:hypothetical protein
MPPQIAQREEADDSDMLQLVATKG